MTEKNIALLDREKHRNIKIDASNYDDVEHQKNISVIMPRELKSVIFDYPVFIIKNPETSEWQLTAMLGFDSGENLFIQNSKWRAFNIPLDVQRRPFQVVAMSDGENRESPLAINMVSARVSETEGENLFDENGEPSAYLKRVQTMYSIILSEMKTTQALLEKLEQYGLIEEVNIDLTFKDGNSTRLTGRYNISNVGLKKLSAEQLHDMNQSGLLQMCHVIQLSMGHLDKLLAWKNERLA